ncbi:MAG: GGDEF domain-containing protein [Betaproteobacteria bacterium]|nr:GGDEF domain-containing protein [Betaproteobacteria bacterium]
MFDIRSLFVVMVATNLILAVSLWIGTGRRPQNGLGTWTLALLAQAASFVLFALRGVIPDWVSILAANALLGVSISLVAAAILAFRGRKLPLFVHFATGAAAAFAVGALIHDFGARLIAVSFLFAAGQVTLLALAWKPTPGVSGGTRGMFVASFALGTASFLVRAVGPLYSPEAIHDFLEPSATQAFSLMAGYTVILLSSVSFLLMQKERADFLAQQLASLDPLTGAFNRRTFIDLAEKQLSRARRIDAPLSLVLLDLDHFKSVNDNHGHLVGDRVLQRFADVVRDQLRKEDVLVRYGGEEFCLLLPDVPGPGAVALAGRIRKAVAGSPFVMNGVEIPLTLSAGVAARIDEGPEGLDQLIGRADEALYMAKNRGRNRVAAVSLGRSKVA